MKPLPTLLSLLALSILPSCYVWTPPEGGDPNAGPFANSGPGQQQTRYIDTPESAPQEQQQPSQPSQQVNRGDPAAPQAPTYVPPQPPPPESTQGQVSNNPPAQSAPVRKDPPPAPPAPPAGGGLPYGIKVPTKPGFVLSPHDKSARIVDVQGIATGTKVKCPYTGKTFLVP
jgi:hypothetical protein